MTNVRAELTATSRKLVRDFGERMTLRKVVSSAYDVDSGSRSTSTRDYLIYVAFVREQRSEEFSLTRSEHRRAYIAPHDCISLDTSDEIIGAGSKMKISVIHGVLEGVDGGVIYICTVQG